MHTEAFEYCAYAASKIGRDVELYGLDILDVGGRNVNGTVHQLFDGSIFTTTDIMNDDGVDFVVDFSNNSEVENLNFGEKFDVAISTEVLEHAPEWQNIVTNMVDSVKSGGWIVITCATDGRPPHSAIDGHYLTAEDTEYYGNVSMNDFMNVVDRLDVDVLDAGTTNTHCDLRVILKKK